MPGVGRAGCLAVLACALLAAPAAANPGDDQWKPVVRDGFGDARTTGVEELEAVGGRLYAATRRASGTGPAGVLATADAGASWQPVPFDPPLTADAVTSLAASADGALIAGSADGLYLFDGAAFKRADAHRVDGGALVTAAHVYFGSGRELWRYDRAAGAVERVLGLKAPVDQVGAIAAFRGRLYAGTRTPGRNDTALYSSATGAPGAWKVVPASRHGFRSLEPGNPSSTRGKHAGVAMAVFDGALIVSIDDPSEGADVVSTR